jgi:hypothetical protein
LVWEVHASLFIIRRSCLPRLFGRPNLRAAAHSIIA